MDDLRLILTNTTIQQGIKDSAGWDSASGRFIYNGYNITVSGATQDILLNNLLRAIRDILK